MTSDAAIMNSESAANGEKLSIHMRMVPLSSLVAALPLLLVKSRQARIAHG